MTIQHDPHTSTFGMPRWAIPAALVAVAATAVIGVTQYRADTDNDVPSRPVSVSDAGDLTQSRVLVQDAIDEALAANRTADLTLSRVLVQDAIDEALAANRTADLTRSRVLVQDAIDEALAANRSPEFTRAQELVQDAIDAALASS